VPALPAREDLQMTAKRMTRRQLNVRLLAIDNVIAMLRGGLSTLESCGAFSAMNPVHDAIRELEETKHDLEIDYVKQTWTAADHQLWSLVCENID